MCFFIVEGYIVVVLFLEDIVVIDVMKLLELEKLEDESYYNMVRELFLFLDFFWVDFLDSLIVNEDKNFVMVFDLVVRDSVDLSDIINFSEVFNFSI